MSEEASASVADIKIPEAPKGNTSKLPQGSHTMVSLKTFGDPQRMWRATKPTHAKL